MGIVEYLHEFDTDNDRIEYENNDYVEPYVSIVNVDNSVHYNNPINSILTLIDGSKIIIHGTGELISSQTQSYKNTLKSVEIKDGCTSIGEGTFSGFTYLRTVTMADSVKVISMNAFSGFNGYEIKLSESLEEIYDNAFKNSSITNLTIPNSVKIIWYNAFENCYDLSSMTLGDSVTAIYDGAFSNCLMITELVIPSSLTEMTSTCFQGCYGITSITVDNRNVVYDSRNNCNAIIETATNKLILACENTTIPNTVEIIDDYSFYNNSEITGLTIPSSVTTIYCFAFKGCEFLTNIICEGTVAPIVDGNLDGISQSGTIYAPIGSTGYETFKTHFGNGWTIEYQ